MDRNSSIRSSLISASTMTEKGLLSDILSAVLLVKNLDTNGRGVLMDRDVALCLLKALEDRSKKRQEVESSSFILRFVGPCREQKECQWVDGASHAT